MSTAMDLDDTASLPILQEQVRSADAHAVAATLQLDAPGPAVGVEEPTDTHPHPFAEGVIRFYRARTILDHDPRGYTLAWQYLKPLSPFDVPDVARAEFIRLAYFVRELNGVTGIAEKQFGAKVRSIAKLIDSFVDELNSQLDG